MKIRIFSSTLVGGVWHEPGIGDYEPGLANHLIELGVAEPCESKVQTVKEIKPVKKTKPRSASQQGQALHKKIAKRHKKAD